MVRIILLVSCLGCAFAGTPRLGSVKELTEPCQASAVANTVCRRLEVSCPDMKPLEVQIRVTQPAAGAPLRGTVVMGSGGGGGSFYAGPPPVQELVKQLSEMGFLV